MLTKSSNTADGYLPIVVPGPKNRQREYLHSAELCQQLLRKSIRRVVARRVGERAAAKPPTEIFADNEKEEAVPQVIE